MGVAKGILQRPLADHFAVGRPEGATKGTMKFYQGSELYLEWHMQCLGTPWISWIVEGCCDSVVSIACLKLECIAVVSKAWLWRGASKLAVPEPWLNGCTEITKITEIENRCCAHTKIVLLGLSCTTNRYKQYFFRMLGMNCWAWAGSCSSI